MLEECCSNKMQISGSKSACDVPLQCRCAMFQVAGAVWQASFVLASYLETQYSSSLSNHRVIELGAGMCAAPAVGANIFSKGLGLVSVACAFMQAFVTSTGI